MFPLKTGSSKGTEDLPNRSRALQNPIKVTGREPPDKNVTWKRAGSFTHSSLHMFILPFVINSSNLLCVKHCAEINEIYLAFRQQLRD